MAKAVTLVHPNATLQVPGKLLVTKSDLFGDDPGLAAVPYHLQSRVSVRDFQEFVSALKGTKVTVTNNNFKGLSQLCEEFRFRDLSAELSQFRESGNFTEDPALFSLQEERIQQHDREIGALEAELSQQLRIHESFEERIRTEAESASRRAKAVEQQVAEVRSEVAKLCNALTEVRKLAEGAQTKAASTEARFEAEVSALRVAPVLPASAPLARPATVVPMAPASTRTPLPHLSAHKSIVPSGWDSAIVADFPKLFEDFKKKKFILLWRGSRDGFGYPYFHSRCDGHVNTLTVILDTDGNIFGGFTPLEWDSRSECKPDPSLRSFLFTLKNPHNVPARRFALKAEKKDNAIFCHSERRPHFFDILGYYPAGGANTECLADLGRSYTNDTGLDRNTVFTCSYNFQVKEIEVFEIAG
jgi:hypothetical protein